MSFASTSMLDHPASGGPEDYKPALGGLSAIVEVHARRLALLYRLLASDGATVPELADAFGLTPAAVRLHLARLTAAGLVLDERLPPGGPGRPRHRYRASEAAKLLLASGSLLDQLSGLLDEDGPGRSLQSDGSNGSGVFPS